MFTLATAHWEASLDASAVPRIFLTKLESSQGKYEDWLKTSRYFLMNIPCEYMIPYEEIFVGGFGLKPREEYYSRGIFLARY